jgi:site-specific DNA-methyltransferase (adenine-specific)
MSARFASQPEPAVISELATAVLPLERLHPWPDNPRSIRADRLQDLKRALAADPEMLAARPLIALPDGTVICGNQRLLAAQELGWCSIPVITVDLDPQRARLWALRDNNPYGDWSEPKLAELLAELNRDGVDLALSGFAGRDLDRLLAGLVTSIDPDDAPSLPTQPESETGQIYQLGPHRLACGNASDPDLIAVLLDGTPADLLMTDPPYGVDYVGKTKKRLTIRNDTTGTLEATIGEVFNVATAHIADSAPFYVFCPAGPQGTIFRTVLNDLGWRHRQTLVWVKNSPVLGHSDYHYIHEEILYGHLPGPGRPGRGRHPGSHWYGTNSETTVLNVERPARSDVHPTMKPVRLLEQLLANSSRRDDGVLDPFAGSGSTLIACERTGRRCFAVEVDPAYCDVIRRRFEEQSNG